MKSQYVPVKPWYKSKTLRVNIIIVAVTAIDAIAGSPVLDAQWRDLLLGVSGVLNIALRLITISPISIRNNS